MRRLSFGFIVGGFWVAASCGGSNSGAPFDSGPGGSNAGFGLECDSDKDCTEYALLCAPELGCAECRDEDDCNRLESCVAGRCREVTSCDNSRDCDTDQVCDAVAGVCVTCVADADCDESQRCEAQECVDVTTCTRSSDCSASEVCDGDQGICVECVVDRDCVAGMMCADTVCVPIAGGGGAPGQMPGDGGEPGAGGSDPGGGSSGSGSGGTSAGTAGTPSGGMSGSGGNAGSGGNGGSGGGDSCGVLQNTAPSVLEVEGTVPGMTGGQIRDGLYYMIGRVDATGSCDCYHKNTLLITGNGTLVEGWFDTSHFNGSIIVAGMDLSFNYACPTPGLGSPSPYTAGVDTLQIYEPVDMHVDYYELQK